MEAHGRGLLEGVHGELALHVPLGGVGDDLLVDEVPDHELQVFLLRGKEILVSHVKFLLKSCGDLHHGLFFLELGDLLRGVALGGQDRLGVGADPGGGGDRLEVVLGKQQGEAGHGQGLAAGEGDLLQVAVGPGLGVLGDLLVVD
ncbi:hypothetical protein SDC9_212623 [bioreactor metagenome]|uniref:Uncharacterized protein n=1 Tax=bioreactor metagenome TaxID=1076179 RepID=A0A645JMG5_9ZZZZ